MRYQFNLDDHLDEFLVIVGFVLVMVGQFARWEHKEELLWWVRTAGAAIALWGGLRKAARAKPFYVVVEPSMWTRTEDGYTYSVPRKKHGRGSTPHSRLTTETDTGAWVECWADAQVVNKGDVQVNVTSPERLRIEVRK